MLRDLRPRPWGTLGGAQVDENCTLARGHALHLDQLGDDLVELIPTTLELAAERANREPPLLLEDFSGALQAGDEAHRAESTAAW